VVIFNLDNTFADDASYTLQTLSALPALPIWLTPVGQAYRFSTSAALPRSSILFQYLERDVPSGQEFGLRVYYSPDEGQTWQRLETELDTDRNLASAEMRGGGIYALVSTIEIPPFQSGWNIFGYPVPGTRPVTEALASIDGRYTSIYNYEPASSSPWTLYDRTVVDQHPEFAGFVNNLTNLEFGRGYWLYATQPVTLYLGVANANLRASSIQWPPATFYGWVIPTGSFAPTMGTEVTAWINGVQCGETTVAELNGQLAYKLQVISEGFAPGGCGADGRNVVFKVGGQTMASDSVWDNRQAWFHSLSDQVSVYLPVVLK
jgi:hypothetical protein